MQEHKYHRSLPSLSSWSLGLLLLCIGGVISACATLPSARLIQRHEIVMPTRVAGHTPRKRPVPRRAAAASQPNPSPSGLKAPLPIRGAVFAKGKRIRLSLKMLRRTLRKAIPGLRRCTRRISRLIARQKRAVKLTVYVGPKGRIWNSKLKSALLMMPRIKRCARRAVERLRFPSRKKGGFAFGSYVVKL